MFYLKQNLPRWERILRVCLGALIAIAAANLQIGSGLLWSAFAVAATLVISGFVGFCPACTMFGRRSIRKAP